MGKYGPWIVDIISFNDAHVANEYQEIHLNSAMNIDSVKINTSLLMMREWLMDNTESEAGCRLCYRLRLKAERQISDIQDGRYGNRQAANYQWESCKLLHARAGLIGRIHHDENYDMQYIKTTQSIEVGELRHVCLRSQ